MPERATSRTDTGCPVCDGSPLVLVAIRHPGMRRLTADLLAREYHCWAVSEAVVGDRLAARIGRDRPDLVVVDDADFPACLQPGPACFPAQRVVVIGPEPDPGYRAHALGAGAGAWIPRERVSDELGPAMRRILGCCHDPCPAPAPSPTAPTAATAPC